MLAGGPYVLTFWWAGPSSMIAGQLHAYGTTLLTFAGLLNLAAIADAWASDQQGQ
jgi:hypothetical protein